MGGNVSIEFTTQTIFQQEL